MKTIGVCGDSWMSPSALLEKAGTHFSELLAIQNSFDLKRYSRPGSSNGAICLQIEQAIKDKCDIILFGTTTHNRIEYTLEEYNENEDCEITFLDLATPSPEAAIINNHANFNYRLAHHTIVHVLEKELFFDIVKNYGKIEDREELELKYQGIKSWFNHMYNPSWKQKIDRYCLYASLHKLHLSNIPYVFVFDFIKIPDAFWLDEPIFGEPYTSKNYIGPVGNDPGYHTTIEEQKDILEKIKQVLRLKGTSIVD